MLVAESHDAAATEDRAHFLVPFFGHILCLRLLGDFVSLFENFLFSNGKWKEILNVIVRVQRTKRVSVTKTARKVLILKRGGGIWKGLESG